MFEELQKNWDETVGKEVELPDGTKHVVGTCLACEGEMTGPSTDGILICAACACGYDRQGQRVSYPEQKRRYKRVHDHGIPWV
jgi:hypothetical protein